MPPPWHPLPANLQPIHLYRHLLRETTYLPPSFRYTIRSLICERFRRHRKHDPRMKTHLAKARTSLRTLRAANSGGRGAMQSLMLKGFSRTGSRRRDLMSDFVRKQGSGNSENLQEVLDKAASSDKATSQARSSIPTAISTDQAAQPRKAQNHPWLDKWDHPKLIAFLKSQKEQEGRTRATTSWPGKSVRDINPDFHIPDSDTWGRSPPPEILVRAKRAKWWASNAAKMEPPLGRGEWELIRNLVHGAQDQGTWAVPARRPWASSTPMEEGKESWNWKPYAQQHIGFAEKAKKHGQQRRSGDFDAGPHGPPRRRMTLTNRWYRRAYSRIWQLTPTMSQNPSTLKYIFKWGGSKPNIHVAASPQLGLFDGVNAKGQRVKHP